MKKVGIYSGTFDPIHEGHLAFAKEALTKCQLDKVFFLTEPRPRRKQGVKAFQHRAEMVRLAIANQPHLGSIVLEQQRFTPAETLPILLERFKGAELHLMIGDDLLSHLADWPDVAKLTQTMQFIIGLRRQNLATALETLKILRETRGLVLRFQLLRTSQPELASSRIKQVLKRGRDPIGLPADVLAYIREHGLYAVSVSESGSK